MTEATDEEPEEVLVGMPEPEEKVPELTPETVEEAPKTRTRRTRRTEN